MFDIYKRAKDLGLKISSWQSDLYIRYSPESAALIEEWKKQKNAVRPTTFIGTDKNRWWELPFQYTPYWENKQKRIDKRNVKG
jgi:hypothetical protein